MFLQVQEEPCQAQSSGEETITEGSESEEEQSGLVASVSHPIPTIEIEEVIVTGEEEEGEETSITESEKSERIEQVDEDKKDHTVPSDSPLESTEPDSSILEDVSEILDSVPMEVKAQGANISAETLSQFEEIERQYDALQEELGISLKSKPTPEEEQWTNLSPVHDHEATQDKTVDTICEDPLLGSSRFISPAEAPLISSTHFVEVDDKFEAPLEQVDVSEITSAEPDVQDRMDEETTSTEQVVPEMQVIAKESEEVVMSVVPEPSRPNDETSNGDAISTTISKLTPTKEIDLLKELELMEQEVSSMKKVVNEVEANVESRKAKIAELVDNSSYPPFVNLTGATETESSSDVVFDVKQNTESVTGTPNFPTVAESIVPNVAKSESFYDNVSPEGQQSVFTVAGATVSESNTDAELQSPESDINVGNYLGKSTSQNFDILSLQSLQSLSDQIKSENLVLTDINIDQPGRTDVKSDRLRPSNFGDTSSLGGAAPLASVESECDDLMKTSSSNTSPMDDPIGPKSVDTLDDLDSDPTLALDTPDDLDSDPTSESVLESVKSEYRRPYKTFKETFPSQGESMVTIAHMKPQQTPNSTEQKDKEKERQISMREAVQKQESLDERSRSKTATTMRSLSCEDRSPKSRSRSPAAPTDLGFMHATGSGLQSIGAAVAAAARNRSNLSACLETEAIKRIDNLLNTARERREKHVDDREEKMRGVRIGAKKAQSPPPKLDERRGIKSPPSLSRLGKTPTSPLPSAVGAARSPPLSPPVTAAGASSPATSPPVLTRTAVQEHMDALDQLVRESQAAADIQLTPDESFVNTRDRKKRKRNRSNQSDSSFTISTPSGSIKSCSSISEIETTPNSNGVSIDRTASGDLLGSSTDADVSLSNLLEDHDESTFSKTAEKTVLSDKTLEQSEGDSSQKDSMAFQSANTTVNDNSVYYTPNTSNVEPMDTSESTKEPLSTKSDPTGTNNTKGLTPNRPKNLDSRSIASDGKSIDSLDDSRNSPLYSPRRSMMDAKKNFFFEPPKPVRIDPNSVFNSPTRKNMKPNTSKLDKDGNAVEVGAEEFENQKNDNITKQFQESPSRKKVGVDPEAMREWKSMDTNGSPTKKPGISGLDLKRDWQSLDSGAPTSPTAGIPTTNVTNGDNDIFYKPGSALKHMDTKESKKRSLMPELKKKDPKKTGDSKSAKHEEKDRSRHLVREKVIEAPKKALLRSKPEVKTISDTVKSSDASTSRTKDVKRPESGTSQDNTTKRSSALFENYPLEPEIPCKVSIIGGSLHEAKTRSLQNKAASIAAGELQNAMLSESYGKPSKDKRSKSKSPLRGHEPPTSPSLQKQESKEEKRDSGDKKDKRRSLLSLLLPSKSVEKREKKKDQKPAKEKESKPKVKTPVKKQESKTKLLKSPRASTSPKTVEQSVQGAEGENRTSLYDEFAPMFDETFGEKDTKSEAKKEKLKERIEQVAPAASGENTIAPKLAPKATGMDRQTICQLVILLKYI